MDRLQDGERERNTGKHCTGKHGTQDGGGKISAAPPTPVGRHPEASECAPIPRQRGCRIIAERLRVSRHHAPCTTRQVCIIGPHTRAGRMHTCSPPSHSGNGATLIPRCMRGITQCLPSSRWHRAVEPARASRPVQPHPRCANALHVLHTLLHPQPLESVHTVVVFRHRRSASDADRLISLDRVVKL